MENTQTQKERETPLVEKISIRLTRAVGTPASIILHTILFIAIFSLNRFGFSWDEILLILTTAVSLEAIYLAIFIQMTVNRQEARLHEVGEEIDEISEDVEDISKDVDEIQEDIGELQEDIGEISEDVEDISEDMQEDDKDDVADRAQRNQRLQKIEDTLMSLIKELEEMRGKK